jgi:hypothetical protein
MVSSTRQHHPHRASALCMSSCCNNFRPLLDCYTAMSCPVLFCLLQKLDDLRALPAAAPATKPSTAPAASTATAAPAAAGGHAGAPTQGQPAAGAAAATAAVPSADAAAVNATSAGASASSTAAQAAGPNSVTITLELSDLRVLEPAAAVFQALTDKAVAQLQQQLSKQQQQRDQQQQQQEQQGSCNPSRPTTSSGARTESTVGAAGMPGSARQTSSSGSCPNTARSQGGGTGAAGGINARASGSGASIGSSSGGGGNAGQAQPPVPLQPLRYHLEVVGPDGEFSCRCFCLFGMVV